MDPNGIRNMKAPNRPMDPVDLMGSTRVPSTPLSLPCKGSGVPMQREIPVPHQVNIGPGYGTPGYASRQPETARLEETYFERLPIQREQPVNPSMLPNKRPKYQSPKWNVSIMHPGAEMIHHQGPVQYQHVVQAPQIQVPVQMHIQYPYQVAPQPGPLAQMQCGVRTVVPAMGPMAPMQQVTYQCVPLFQQAPIQEPVSGMPMIVNEREYGNCVINSWEGYPPEMVQHVQPMPLATSYQPIGHVTQGPLIINSMPPKAPQISRSAASAIHRRAPLRTRGSGEGGAPMPDDPGMLPPSMEQISHGEHRHYMQPVQYVERYKAMEPLKYVEPLKYMEPLKYVDPLKYVEQKKYVEPLKYLEAAKYIEPLKYVEPMKHNEKVNIREPVHKVEHVKYQDRQSYIEPVKYVEVAQLMERPKPEDPARFIGSVRPDTRPMDITELTTQEVWPDKAETRPSSMEIFAKTLKQKEPENLQSGTPKSKHKESKTPVTETFHALKSIPAAKAPSYYGKANKMPQPTSRRSQRITAEKERIKELIKEPKTLQEGSSKLSMESEDLQISRATTASDASQPYKEEVKNRSYTGTPLTVMTSINAPNRGEHNGATSGDFLELEALDKQPTEERLPEVVLQPRQNPTRGRSELKDKVLELKFTVPKPAKRVVGKVAPVQDKLLTALSQLRLFRLNTPIPLKQLRAKASGRASLHELNVSGSLEDCHFDPACCDQDVEEAMEQREPKDLELGNTFLYKCHMGYTKQGKQCWCVCYYDIFGSFVKKEFLLEEFGFNLAQSLAQRCRENAEATFHMLWMQKKRESLDCSIPCNATSTIVERFAQLEEVLLRLDRQSPLALQLKQLVKLCPS